MIDRSKGLGLRILGCAAFLALPVIVGCATTPTDAEQELNFKKAESHRQLGMDHLANGRPERALRELMMSDRLNPMHPKTLYGLSRAYLIKGKETEGEQKLLDALTVHPEYHEARYDLSTLYIQQERWEEAIFQCAILLDDPTFPAPWTAHNNTGWAAFHLGREGEAREHLQLAREYNDEYWPSLINLAILENREGHRLEAVELFNRALELDLWSSAKAETHYRLAEVYVSLGKRDRAVGHLKTAVAQAPNDKWGKKSEDYLKILR
jgi:tetratricopeptide (TPR) repeat protein